MIKKYIQNQLDKAGPRIALALLEEIQIEAPVDTGRLRSSLKIIYRNKILIISGVDYILHIEFGTKPHIIRPKTKKSLKFEVGKKARLGRKEGPDKALVVFAKEVKHPGTKPNPFIRDTVFRKLRNIIVQELNR